MSHSHGTFIRFMEECKATRLFSVATTTAADFSQVLGDVTTTIDSKQFSAIEPQLLRVEEVVWPAPPGYRCVENENAQSPGRPRIKLRQELPEWKPLLHDLADFGRENPALSVGIIHHISSPLCTPEFPELLQEAWTRTNCRENAPQTAYNAALATWALLADWSLK